MDSSRQPTQKLLITDDGSISRLFRHASEAAMPKSRMSKPCQAQGDSAVPLMDQLLEDERLVLINLCVAGLLAASRDGLEDGQMIERQGNTMARTREEQALGILVQSVDDDVRAARKGEILGFARVRRTRNTSGLARFRYLDTRYLDEDTQQLAYQILG
ncbi:hypothetical protein E4U41_002169 [Claviceps citrina]|nr:hypothetical protein E4U41_002169 [Claviceps citrina]